MCGICGIACADPNAFTDERTVVAMRDSLIHRGPDDAGIFIEAGIGLGSRRLSILDLSANGHMPMTTADGRYTITFNGEVYNFKSLREMLEKRGHVFRTGTDTEVVLHMFAELGPKMLDQLNGMFAFAIWDRRDRALFIARDRLGVKPLYYAFLNRNLHFASEPKALIASGIAATFDHDTWEELLCFRYVTGERTPLRNVTSLLPGHYLWWRAGELRITRWWKLADRIVDCRASLPSDEIAWFQKTFDDAVDLRRIADVPVGVMLSGGLDSGTVAASLATLVGPGIHGFTVRFDEASHDESPLARQVTSRWHMVGHEISVERPDLLDRLRQASRLLDAPLAHANDAHMLALSEVARSQVKVLLSGEGADETLNGYVRYQPLRFPRLLGAASHPIASQLMSRLKPGRVQKLARMVAEAGASGLVRYNACDVFPSELRVLGAVPRSENGFRDAILEEARLIYPRDLLRQAMYLDQHTFLTSLLDRNDRMTMGASIECRVPFLDYRLVETLAAMPTHTLLRTGTRKAILRRALGYRLPMAVRRHKKWGFGIPWELYLREEPTLRREVERLPDSEVVASGPLDRLKVKHAVDRFLAGSSNDFALVKALLMVSVWYDEAILGRRHAIKGAA